MKIKKKIDSDKKSSQKSQKKEPKKVLSKIGKVVEENIFNGKVRLNKRIKDLGLAGRREADTLIEKGKVLVNGKKAKIGDKIKLTDEIKIEEGSQNYLYYMFNKPKDVVSHSPQFGEPEVKEFFKNWEKDHLTIVGRLDKHSEGLMLVTNDKRLVERILDPRYDHEKTYEVTVQEKLSQNIVRLFAKGFSVRGRFEARPAKVEIINNFHLRITLTEGKKHQIRLMLNELKYTVSKLKRVSIMNIKLKGVEPGKFKEIEKSEVKKLLKLCGL